MDLYKIVNTTSSDLDFIYMLFDEAIAYQKRKNYPVWKGYDKVILQKDIENRLHYKILYGDDIACIFSLSYAEPILWREKERGDAIYIHRIVTNSKHKGQKQFERILNWVIDLARKNNYKYIRMDTWADNSNIVDYYKSFGFKLVGTYITPVTLDLPIQKRNIALALLEFTLV
jgi:GNAT superfamily N-acetyltransferase